MSRADLRSVIAPCSGHEVITIVGDGARVKAQLRERRLDFAGASAAPPAR